MDTLAGRFVNSQIFVDRAYGPWLVNEDGRWVDHVLGNCSQLLGHTHPHVVDRVTSQISRMTNVGDHKTEAAFALADRVLEVSGMSAARFVSSGSEAVHLALRTARAATARNTILKFAGHYHGWFTEELSRFVPHLEYPDGLPRQAADNLIVVDWNDREAVAAVFETHGAELAGVICEPMLCHAGPVPAEDGYLAYLRDMVDSVDALLIFDECITGFRLARGGAQERFGVRADLVTYSKALSAGFPLGVCAGTARAMAPLAEGRAYQAATYDANSVSVAAAHAVLDVLENEPVYERIASYGERLRTFIGNELDSRGVANVCQGDPSVFQFFFTDRPVRNHREALNSDIAFYSLLVDELLKSGVNVLKGDLRSRPDASWLSQWFVSASHDDEAFEWTARAYPEALDAALDRRAGV